MTAATATVLSPLSFSNAVELARAAMAQEGIAGRQY